MDSSAGLESSEVNEALYGEIMGKRSTAGLSVPPEDGR